MITIFKSASRPTATLCLLLIFLTPFYAQAGEIAKFPPALNSPKRKIVYISGEAESFPTTGGMGSAVGEEALMAAEYGHDVTILVPGYRTNATNPDLAGKKLRFLKKIAIDLDRGPDGKFGRKEIFDLMELKRPGKPTLWFLNHIPRPGEQNYFANTPNIPGERYGGALLEREAFGAFSKAGAEAIIEGGFEVGFAADWHAGLTPLFLKEAARKRKGIKAPPFIAEIHNAGYKGETPKGIMDVLGIDWKEYQNKHDPFSGLEFFDRVSYLKGLVENVRLIKPVSMTYGREIQTWRFGHDFAGLFQNTASDYSLTPLQNGFREKSWDPEIRHENNIEYAFTAEDLKKNPGVSGKAKGKEVLQKTFFGADQVDPKRPLIVMTSRLEEQKGWSYLVPAIERTSAEMPEAQFLIMGSSEGQYTSQVRELAANSKNRVKFIEFDRKLEHPFLAYSDFFVNVSRWEPSGLNQLYSLKNGTIPIVSYLGGHKDTVQHGITGYHVPIHFDGHSDRLLQEPTVNSVYHGLVGAITDFKRHPESIKRMRIKGMEQMNDWSARTHEFNSLVEFAIEDGPAKLKSILGPGPKGAVYSAIELRERLHEVHLGSRLKARAASPACDLSDRLLDVARVISN